MPRTSAIGSGPDTDVLQARVASVPRGKDGSDIIAIAIAMPLSGTGHQIKHLPPTSGSHPRKIPVDPLRVWASCGALCRTRGPLSSLVNLFKLCGLASNFPERRRVPSPEVAQSKAARKASGLSSALCCWLHGQVKAGGGSWRVFFAPSLAASICRSPPSKIHSPKELRGCDTTTYTVL